MAYLGAGGSEEVVIHTRLTGQRQVTSGLAAEAGAMAELQAETDRFGLSVERTAKRSFLMNQALYTTRRLIYGTSLALVAAGAVALKWGWDFNSTMQQGRVALGQFMGSTSAANAELNKLYYLSAYTPFQFKDLVSAASMLMRFNVSAGQTNRILADITDALAGTSKATPAGLNRISTALGHMMSMGRVTGQVLLQLARDGIPGVYDATKKYFGLTPQQMAHIGSLNLPADQEMKAIEQYIEGSRLHGLARRLQESTLHGVFTTFKDFTSQLMGNIETRPFAFVQRFLSKANPVINSMNKGFKANGFAGLFTALNAGLGNSALAGDIRNLAYALTNVWHIFYYGLVPVIRDFLHLMHPFGAVLYLAAGFLGFFAHHMTLTKIILAILIADWIRARIAILAFAAAERYSAMVDLLYARRMTYTLIVLRTYGALLWTARIAMAAFRAETYAAALIMIRMRIATLLANIAMLRAVATMSLFYLKLAVLALRQREWWIAMVYARGAVVMLARAIWTLLVPAFIREAIVAAAAWVATLGPIAWIIAGIVLLVATLTALYLKWGWLHRTVNAFVHDVLHGNSLIDNSIRVMLLGPLGLVIDALMNIKRIYDSIKRVFNWFFGGGGGPSTVGSYGIHMANAAPSYSGISGGGVVKPISAPTTVPSLMYSDTHSSPHIIELHVDGKKLAQVVADHKNDVRARR